MTQWAMVIDLRRCSGCSACIIACSQANHIKPHFWRKCIELIEPQRPQRERYFLTMGCMHCQSPPCRDVCPTKATNLREDGIVAIEYKKCIGCGYCIVACPYNAREIFMSEADFEEHPSQSSQRYLGHEAVKDIYGVCTKCSFCLPYLEKGLAEKLVPGKDAGATPWCVVACSFGALNFGDLHNPESNVARLLAENASMRLSEDLGTAPSVYYIL